ncbi:MAG: hypothetical protein EAY75_10170 [Bacteroidetes bacterium]|nr:MAG: hypothetical protein EAY75_10170 [Bacteroidota bacterium]
MSSNFLNAIYQTPAMNPVSHPKAAIEILMIDDDKQQHEALTNYAAIQYGVMLLYARTLDEGMQLLQNNRRILAVILDGKGLIYKHQTGATASEAFVHEALTRIAVLETKLNKTWPKCVLTAWYGFLINSLGSRVKVYDKKEIALDEAVKRSMFENLLLQTADSKAHIIRQKFGAYFAMAHSKAMPQDFDAKLYQCLEKMEYNTAEQSHFNTLRSLYELLFKKMHSTDERLAPVSVFHPAGNVNLDWSLRHLRGWDIKGKNGQLIMAHPTGMALLPEGTIACFAFVKDICNAYSHLATGHMGQHMYKAAVHAYLAILDWFEAYTPTAKP